MPTYQETIDDYIGFTDTAQRILRFVHTESSPLTLSVGSFPTFLYGKSVLSDFLFGSDGVHSYYIVVVVTGPSISFTDVSTCYSIRTPAVEDTLILTPSTSVQYSGGVFQTVQFILTDTVFPIDELSFIDTTIFTDTVRSDLGLTIADIFQLVDIVFHSSAKDLIEHLQFSETLRGIIITSYEDTFTVTDMPALIIVMSEELLSQLFFADYLYLLPSLLNSLNIYVDTVFPSMFVFVYLPRPIFGVDNLVLQEDGIYELDYNDVLSDTVLALNPSDWQVSRVKRIDKILANSDLDEAVLYVDDNKYTISSNGKWINVPKGIKGKDYKIVLKEVKDIDFVEIRYIQESRAK